MSDAGHERGQALTRAQYEAIDAINWSLLRSMRISPKQFQHDRTNGRADTASMKLGRAVHVAVFEPQRFESEFVVYQGAVRRGKEWEAFRQLHEHHEIITRDEQGEAIAIRDAVFADPIARDYLRGGYAEQSFTWQDFESKLMCKCRVDLVHEVLVELKSTNKIVPGAFASEAARLGYHGQIAFYYDGIRANGISLERDPVLISVQNEAPYDVAVYRVPPEVLMAGRIEYGRLLLRLLDCFEYNEWPGVAGDEELTFRLPEWAMSQPEKPFTIGGVPIDFNGGE